MHNVLTTVRGLTTVRANHLSPSMFQKSYHLFSTFRVLSGEFGLGGKQDVHAPYLGRTHFSMNTINMTLLVCCIFLKSCLSSTWEIRGITVKPHTNQHNSALVNGGVNEATAGQPTCYIKHIREKLLV